jgi:tetratricopeptide (TPR) repeat protein
VRRATRVALAEALKVVPLEQDEAVGVAGLIRDVTDWDDDFVAGVLLDLGARASSVDEPGLAIELYELSAALGRSGVGLFYNLGNALVAVGDDDAAIAAYDEAIGLDPAASLPRYNRGIARLRADDPGGLGDLIEAARLGETFPMLYPVLCGILIERSGFQSAYALLDDDLLPAAARALLLDALSIELASTHYQLQRPAAMPFQIDESLRRTCVLGDVYLGAVPPGADTTRLEWRFSLLDQLLSAAKSEPDAMSDWLVDHVEGLLAYAPIGVSHFPEDLPWDVPHVLTVLIEGEGHEVTVHDRIDHREPDLPSERTEERLARFAQRCFRRAAASLRNHPDVTVGGLDASDTGIQWSVSEDLYREWARCCAYLDSPLELVEVIEEARHRSGALALHLLPGNAPSELEALLPTVYGMRIGTDPALAVGEQDMLLDYFTAETVEDRLLCAVVSPNGKMLFETAISTAKDKAAQSTLEALLEANEHYVPTPLRHDQAVEALDEALDDPAKWARARAALLGVHFREFPDQIDPGLDDILLGPARDRLDGVERLVVAPFNYLHNFPFHALDTIQERVRDGSLREVVYVPSARLAVEFNNRPQTGPQAERCLFVGYAENDDLPVEEELTLVSNRFVQTEVLAGDDATTGNVLRHLGNADVVHFCCHGGFDSTANAIYIALADGGLYPRDILTSPQFTPQLVFANTCVSGASQRFGLNGDQPLSLPAAALFRGSRNVISTLWKVRDDVAIDFASQFYGRWLTDQEGVGRAAQATQRDLKDSYQKLHLWAAHAVFGGG